MQWQEYCRCAATVDRQRILEVVLSDLDSEDSPLYALIDSARRPRMNPAGHESLTVLASIEQAILDRVAKAVDDQVNLRMVVEVPHV